MANIGGTVQPTLTVAATMTHAIDTSVAQTLIAWTATMNSTLNLTGTPSDGQWLILIINNDATPRTITLGTGFLSKGTIIGTASKKTVVEFIAYGGTFHEAAGRVTVL